MASADSDGDHTELASIDTSIYGVRGGAVEVRVRDAKDVSNKLRALQKAGKGGFQVISDFDFTITKYWLDGKRSPSCYSSIRASGVLGEAYNKRAEANFNKYHPYELSHSLSYAEKVEKMTEWWQASNQIMIDFGFTHEKLLAVAKKAPLAFRERSEDFLELLDDSGVPLVIFSAGIADVIKESLEEHDLYFPNQKYLANHLQFSEETGKMTGLEGPLIHSLNKFEKSEDLKKLLEVKRRNLILLGDQIGDAKMAELVDADVVLRIGFLNVNTEEANIGLYLEAYDVVICNDGSFEVPIDIIRTICDPSLDVDALVNNLVKK